MRRHRARLRLAAISESASNLVQIPGRHRQIRAPCALISVRSDVEARHPNKGAGHGRKQRRRHGRRHRSVRPATKVGVSPVRDRCAITVPGLSLCRSPVDLGARPEFAGTAVRSGLNSGSRRTRVGDVAGVCTREPEVVFCRHWPSRRLARRASASLLAHTGPSTRTLRTQRRPSRRLLCAEGAAAGS